MIDVIQGKFTEIASKCLEKNAKAEGVKKTDVQLIFKLGQSGDAEYLIYKQYKPLKVLTFLEVLGVRIDFKGYSLFVPSFIKGALNRNCTEHNISKEDVRIMLLFNEKNDMFMWLYDGSNCIKQVDLESMVNGEDILSINQ